MITLTTYLVLHLSSIIVLLGYTFYAFAAPAETRKRVLMITGTAALLVLVTGFGMLAPAPPGLSRLGHRQAGVLARAFGHRRHRLPQARIWRTSS